MTSLIRKVILLGDGLTFLLIAFAVLFVPEKAAYVYGYTLNGVDGLNEFRAVYIGFWIGLTILFFVALWKYKTAIIGDLGLLMILLQALGRCASFVLDGIPSERFVIACLLEVASSLIALLIRPQRSLRR